MPPIDTSIKVSQTFLAKAATPADKEIWRKAYVKYLIMTYKDPEEASTQRPNYQTLLITLR